MRTEYHEKLADIEEAFEEKDMALTHDRVGLERELAEARDDVRLYGDEFEVGVEYGMILPETVSARQVLMPEPMEL